MGSPDGYHAAWFRARMGSLVKPGSAESRSPETLRLLIAREDPGDEQKPCSAESRSPETLRLLIAQEDPGGEQKAGSRDQMLFILTPDF